MADPVTAPRLAGFLRTCISDFLNIFKDTSVHCCSYRGDIKLVPSRPNRSLNGHLHNSFFLLRKSPKAFVGFQKSKIFIGPKDPKPLWCASLGQWGQPPSDLSGETKNSSWNLWECKTFIMLWGAVYILLLYTYFTFLVMISGVALIYSSYCSIEAKILRSHRSCCHRVYLESRLFQLCNLANMKQLYLVQNEVIFVAN